MLFFHILLGILYVIPVIIFIIYYRMYYLKDPNDKFFFLWGFLMKIFGAVCAVMIYTYYYRGGDTMYYFQSGNKLSEYLLEYPSSFTDLFFLDNLSKYDDVHFMAVKPEIVYYKDTSSYTITKISIFLNLITFHSFLLSSILCSYFSFFCSWRFYKFISTRVRLNNRHLGYAIFFIPSAVFWGSGLFKDTFTLSALYIVIISLVSFFGYRSFKISYLFYLLLGLYLLLNVRSFFLLSVFPFISLWIIFINYKTIPSMAIRFFLIPIFFLISIGTTYLIFQSITQTFQGLSIENLASKSQGFQDWHTTLKGSAYSLGKIDYTLTGILKKVPAAINVSLFRPYLWEANKPIILLSAFQSLFFVVFTVYIFIRLKIIYFFKFIFKSPSALSLMGFSLFYAFVSGFTSYNFGALDRYKIPCLSPYIISLLIVYADYNFHFKKGLWK